MVVVGVVVKVTDTEVIASKKAMKKNGYNNTHRSTLTGNLESGNDKGTVWPLSQYKF